MDQALSRDKASAGFAARIRCCSAGISRFEASAVNDGFFENGGPVSRAGALLTLCREFSKGGTNLAAWESMTRKRYRRSLAVLGILAAFFMVLIVLLLMPTLASAGRDSENARQHAAKPDTAPLHAGPGGVPHDVTKFDKTSRNEPDHGHTTLFGGSDEFCLGGANACADSDGRPGFGYIRAGGIGGSSGDGNAHGAEGSGTPNGFGNARFSGGFIAGGFGQGGGGGRPGHEDSGNPGSDHPNKDDADSGGPNVPLLDLTPPGDDDVGPVFLDDENPPVGDPPKSSNPPPSLDAPTPIPEPLTLSLFVVGLAGSAALRRRQRAKQA